MDCVLSSNVTTNKLAVKIQSEMQCYSVQDILDFVAESLTVLLAAKKVRVLLM